MNAHSETKLQQWKQQARVSVKCTQTTAWRCGVVPGCVWRIIISFSLSVSIWRHGFWKCVSNLTHKNQTKTQFLGFLCYVNMWIFLCTCKCVHSFISMHACVCLSSHVAGRYRSASGSSVRKTHPFCDSALWRENVRMAGEQVKWDSLWCERSTSSYPSLTLVYQSIVQDKVSVSSFQRVNLHKLE